MSGNSKIKSFIAALIFSLISVHCSSSSTLTRIYEGPYWGTNSSNNAVVVGRVTDKEDNSPLIGAPVILVDSSIGGAVDQKGNYVIFNIPPGVYDLYASYIGYKSAYLYDVKLDGNTMYIIDFELVPEEYVL